MGVGYQETRPESSSRPAGESDSARGRSPHRPDDLTEFALDVSVQPPTAVLTANGELDIFTASDVGINLRDALARGCSHIVIDVAGVSFVDASALGVFARTHVSLAEDGGTMEFVGASPQFRRLCCIVRLDNVFGLTSVG
jgi:anti-sigma B factor antagonist